LAIINAPHSVTLNSNLSGRNKEVSRWEAIKQVLTFSYIAIIRLPWPFYTIFLTWRDYEIVRWCTSDKGHSTTEDVDIYVAAFALPGVATCVHAYYKSLFEPVPKLNTLIRMPTVVIWGTDDVALREQACLTGLEHYVEDLQICTMKGATHFNPESSHQRVNTILRDFLQKGNDIDEDVNA
jgi:pimeloyl-ACP methyl ester carboxylesterase